MKPRSDSVIEGLPRNQREAIEGWLFEENVSLDAAVERLRLDFDVCCSRSALGRFYRRVSQRRLVERITTIKGTASAVSDAFEKNAAPVSGALRRMLEQIAFEKAVGGEIEPEVFSVVSNLALKAADQELRARKLELDERKVRLLEKKAAQAEEAETTLSDQALSEAEKQLKLRAIFGIRH